MVLSSSRVNAELKQLLGDDYEDAFTFSELDLDFNKEKSRAVDIWHKVVAVSALLDVAAEVVSHQPFGIEQRNPQNPASLCYFGLYWLYNNRNNLALIFSFAWFLDAFVQAHRVRLRTSRWLDRKRLLGLEDSDQAEDWWYGAWGTYIRTVMVQVMLLPVGFFVEIGRLCRAFRHPVTTAASIAVVSPNHHSFCSNNETVHSIFTYDSRVSLGFALLRQLWVRISNWMGEHMSDLHSSLRAFAKGEMIRRAIRNPFRFWKKFQTFVLYRKWTRYMVPIIQSMHKLRMTLFELAKRTRQHRAARLARRDRRQAKQDMTEQELLEVSATIIQATYRSHSTRRHLHYLALMRCTRQQMAAIKIQRALRRMLARIRSRRKEKIVQLRMLKTKERSMRGIRAKRLRRSMSVSERRHLYELEKEMRNEAALLLNKELLLNPSSTFVVVWGILLVFSLVGDVAAAVLRPTLVEHKDKLTGSPMQLKDYILFRLLPIPVARLKVCKPRKITLLDRILSLIVRKTKPLAPKPWYCGVAYTWIQSVVSLSIKSLVYSTFTFFVIFRFLHVFVVCFTGEIDNNTGALRPKPPFRRWIIPGLLFQLVVNPQMANLSDFLSSVVIRIVQRDPQRVMRWTVALFYPVSLFVMNGIKVIWLAIVDQQNRSLEERFPNLPKRYDVSDPLLFLEQ